MSDELLNRIVIGTLLALLSVLVAVGLIVGKLDPTAVAISICTLIGGIFAGQALRKRDGGDEP